MSNVQLAQINIARLVAPLDDPDVAAFTRAIDAVNALGEAHPGFVWRLTDTDGGTAEDNGSGGTAGGSAGGTAGGDSDGGDTDPGTRPGAEPTIGSSPSPTTGTGPPGSAGTPGGATGLRWPGAPDDEQLIVNLTVWSSHDDLREFVFRSGHAHYLQRRFEWFERGSSRTALWWVPDGHRPDLVEAYDRTEHLRQHGPSPYAFRLSDTFGPPA